VVAFAPDVARSLTARHDSSPCVDRGMEVVAQPGLQVRRLTPTECERLQGFPDGHTLIPFRGKPAADGPRYKALGNSMAVPVMSWVAKQIEIAESGLT
jgi:DNA (cytosine-5)-methyltransferase 1